MATGAEEDFFDGLTSKKGVPDSQRSKTTTL